MMMTPVPKYYKYYTFRSLSTLQLIITDTVQMVPKYLWNPAPTHKYKQKNTNLHTKNTKGATIPDANCRQCCRRVHWGNKETDVRIEQDVRAWAVMSEGGLGLPALLKDCLWSDYSYRVQPKQSHFRFDDFHFKQKQWLSALNKVLFLLLLSVFKGT